MYADTSIDGQIRCVEREMAFRTRVYPKRIARNRMTQERSGVELAEMQAVLDSLRLLKVSMEAANTKT